MACWEGSARVAFCTCRGRPSARRHVTVEHQHRRIVGDAGHRLRDGVTGAEPLALLHPFDVGRGHGFAHSAAAMPVHDVHARRAQPAGRVDDVGQERAPGEKMQDLRQVRAHTLPLPCRENDHVQRRHAGGRTAPGMPENGSFECRWVHLLLPPGHTTIVVSGRSGVVHADFHRRRPALDSSGPLTDRIPNGIYILAGKPAGENGRTMLPSCHPRS